ncbi:MAG TPA: hypothetical protein VHM67_03695 [Gemmatimonadaceae bacterium]|nr:hypothetical protein [Gemmatimonadaceae bacterium]
MMQPGEVMVALATLLGATVVLFPIARAFGRWIDRRGSQPAVPRHDDQRLERIESAVDAIALEIERISEAQRFTTRLLAERSGGDPPRRSPAAPSR